MKHHTRRSRRHRNPRSAERTDRPFFGKKRAETGQTEAPSSFFQPKLKVGEPGDAYEQEADQVADAVTGKSGNAPALQAQGISRIQRYMTNAQEDELGTNTQRMEKDKAIQEKPELQRMEEEKEPMAKKEEEEPQAKEEEEALQQQTEEEEETLQQQAGDEEEESLQQQEEEEEAAPAAVQSKPEANSTGKPASLRARLRNARGGGHPLPAATRARMEAAMGADFSQVRIHTDRQSREMNKGLRSQAFTYGKDIFFNNGKYRPETAAGQHLLAHELTHVVQQGKAGSKARTSTGPAVQRQDAGTPAVAGAQSGPSVVGLLDDTPTTYVGYSPFFNFRLAPEGPLPKIGAMKIIHRVYYENDPKLEKEDKQKFADNFEQAVERIWSDKYMFHLKEAGFAEYKMKVAVDVVETDKPDQAHTRITIHKRAPDSKRLRSSVTDDQPGGATQHTAQLDYRDPTEEEEKSPNYSDRIWQVGPFDHDDDQLNADVMQDIREVESTIRPLQKGSDPRLLLGEEWYVDYVGRATSVGNPSYNKKLGRRRAEKVDEKIAGDLGRPQATGRVSSEGETHTTNEDKFRRVDVKLWSYKRNFEDPPEQVKHNVAAHEAGHMFGLGDEYVDEDPPENVRKKFQGDKPTHYDLVQQLMGQEAADELLIQNTGSLMAIGNEVKRGHYVFFLQALNKATGKNWNIIPTQTA